MAKEKDTPTYTCPHCHRPVRIVVRNGKWKYVKHNNNAGQVCRMSGAQL